MWGKVADVQLLAVIQTGCCRQFWCQSITTPCSCLWSAAGLVCLTVASLQELSTTYLHDHLYLVLQQTHHLVWCLINCYITVNWFIWCFFPKRPTAWIQSNSCKYLKNVELLSIRLVKVCLQILIASAIACVEKRLTNKGVNMNILYIFVDRWHYHSYLLFL